MSEAKVSKWLQWLPVAAILFFVGSMWWTDHWIKSHNTVTITQQDIVRYCMDRRRAHSPAKEIEYYCGTLWGDYYIAQGVQPNYEKFDSRSMFPAPSEATQ